MICHFLICHFLILSFTVLSPYPLRERRFGMKKVFAAADRYIETSNWKTIAVLKFCLLALGIIIGMQVRKEHRKRVLGAAGIVFILTYIPLMAKFFRTLKEV
jgi:H+/Cl- antiporter ClcA